MSADEMQETSAATIPPSTPSTRKRGRQDYSPTFENEDDGKEGIMQLLQQVLGKIDGVKEEQKITSEKIDVACDGWKAALHSLQQKVTKQEEVIEAQANIISQQGKKLQEMEVMFEDLYCSVNENNLIIRGLAFRNVGEARQEIVILFRHLDAIRPPIFSIKQLGRTNKVLVKFVNSGDKFFLQKHSAYLRSRNVYLEDDLPMKLKQDKDMLLMRRRELLENGVATTVKVLRRALVVDNQDLFVYDRHTGTMDKRKPEQKKSHSPQFQRHKPSQPTNQSPTTVLMDSTE